ncbi:MAG: Ger(x)C family spore germination protein [Veillonellaceae bacterium]|jgi:spore germination protein KC|nr:Ger(x)C family spore germination protein [Veillonellaceae bacterium]
MRRMILALLLLVFTLLSVGCFGSRETDENAFVLVVGFDKSKRETGKLDVTFQIAVPRALATEGGKSEDITILGTITADTLAEARSMQNSGAARAPSWSHTKIIIIGDELAKQGLGQILGPIMRFREVRGSILLIVVNDDSAQNFMKKHNPKIDVVPTRFYETMLLASNESSYFPRTNLHEFYTRLKEGCAAPIIALGGINKFEDSIEPTRRKTSPNKVDEFEAGNLPRVGNAEEPEQAGTPAEIMGTAVFHDDKMVGILNSQETRMMEILRGKFRQGFYSVEDPVMPGVQVTLDIRLGERPKLTAELNDGQASLGAEVFIEAEITNLPSGTNFEMEEYRPMLEEQLTRALEKSIMKMLDRTQAMQTDVVGFGYVARTNFRTYDEFMKLNWPEIYSQAEFQVKVKTKIRRTGLMWKTIPNKVD